MVRLRNKCWSSVHSYFPKPRMNRGGRCEARTHTTFQLDSLANCCDNHYANLPEAGSVGFAPTYPFRYLAFETSAIIYLCQLPIVESKGFEPSSVSKMRTTTKAFRHTLPVGGGCRTRTRTTFQLDTFPMCSDNHYANPPIFISSGECETRTHTTFQLDTFQE